MSDLNYNAVPPEQQKKAKTFFQRGAQVAAAGQWDYAIEMYMNGLNLDPEAVEEHQALRDIALRRKVSGGKKMGMFEAMKWGSGSKDFKQNFLNAERQLSFDPGDTSLMLTLADNAFKAGCYDTVLWIGDILKKAIDDAGGGTPKSGDLSKLQKLRDIYANLKRYSEAVDVSARVVRLRPDDSDQKDIHKNLAALEAMQKGGYQTAKSFRDSIRDREGQQKLIESDKDVGNEDYLEKLVRDAEAQLAADPNEQGKMAKVIDALRKLATPEGDARAMARANEFYEKTRAFRFKMSVNDIRLKQLHQEDRAFRAKYAALTDANEKSALNKAYLEFAKKRAEEELGIYEEIAGQYPTESKWKYEIANRLVLLGRHTDAIPIFQEAVQDPKLRNEATLKLGQAFLAAEFYDEAVDTLKTLMESYQVTGDATAKEIYYWHARSSEAANNIPDALKSYSQVMKWEFNYRDVQKRIKDLRAKAAQG
ncbi:MAG: hypothetical protein QM770_13795 [Tepidisphaeraceae bacterium]